MPDHPRLGSLVLVLCGVVTTLLVAAAPVLAGSGFGERKLRLGDRGADVERLQELLTDLGFDTRTSGKFGAATETGVRAYESAFDMPVDGVVSMHEADKLKRRARRARQEAEDRPQQRERHRLGDRKLQLGMHGRDVRKLQRLLTKMAIPVHADGDFGPRTAKGVRRYERWRKMRVDGIVPGEQAARIERDAERGKQRPSEADSRRTHSFPVRGAWSFGGEGSRFGAPRSGHTHRGQDIAAPAGSKVVSVHKGRVAVVAYQASGAGHYVVVHGKDGRDSVYMHFETASNASVGERVRAGEKIGRVGCTGTCFGPHLHFELWTPHWYDGGHPYDPLPKLQDWAG